MDGPLDEIAFVMAVALLVVVLAKIVAALEDKAQAEEEEHDPAP